MGRTIYRAENITITERSVEAGGMVIAVNTIQTVWIARRSMWMWLQIVGVLAMMFGGTMGSCGGLLIGALQQEESMSSWLTKAFMLIGGGVALLIVPRFLPPFVFTVTATIGGLNQGIYQTRDLKVAQDIQRAITAALTRPGYSSRPQAR
jgi:hypothetical protein